MDNLIYTKVISAPPVNRREVLRYAGVAVSSEECERLLDECISAAGDSFSYKICYRELPVSECGGVLDLGFCRSSSETLRKALSGCDRIILFAASVGVEIDRLIARTAAVSPARASVLQALGSERVESLCDAFCAEMSALAEAEGRVLRPRVSAGYGDIPLLMQREIFAALDCARRLGISLGENLMMSPSKSVTAIMGLREKI